MTKVSITHIKSDGCDVCQSMKPEISVLKKRCEDGNICRVRVLNYERLNKRFKKSLANKNGDVEIPILQIKKGDQVREFEGYMNSEQILNIIREDW